MFSCPCRDMEDRLKFAQFSWLRPVPWEFSGSVQYLATVLPSLSFLPFSSLLLWFSTG
ncbi:hypothetical protein BDV36DRAFT_264117 [Aspergillus pseudocaelatus]|uniref:Uncharacterized protein n=1 Tax=Aspergillus pseudocaelatus TaxID=1825620 RepID=A0ABQ6WFM4_9EURO|nr:hypothetical protein BDV36DRAFT_264117 [Aspergillus pseudocaelatus]